MRAVVRGYAYLCAHGHGDPDLDCLVEVDGRLGRSDADDQRVAHARVALAKGQTLAPPPAKPVPSAGGFAPGWPPRRTRPTCPGVDVKREAVQWGEASGVHRSGKSASSCWSVVASRIRGRTSVMYSVGSTPFAMQEPTSE